MCSEYSYKNSMMNIDEGITLNDGPIYITTFKSFDDQLSQNLCNNTEANGHDDQLILNDYLNNELNGPFNINSNNQRREPTALDIYLDNYNNDDNDNSNNNRNSNSINNNIENERNNVTEVHEDNNENKTNKTNIFKIITIPNPTGTTREISRSIIPVGTSKNNNGEKLTGKKTKRKFKNTKNMGRKKNNDKNKIGKYREDNIRTKVKRFFINSLINFINILIIASQKLDGNYKIQKLNNEIITNMKKENLLKFFDSSARAFLSQDISVKCKRMVKNYNKKLIDKIYEVKETTITYVLDKSIRELFDIFCNKISTTDVHFENFERLEKSIMNELKRDKDESEKDYKNYINNVKYQALNFEKIIIAKDGRNERNES